MSESQSMRVSNGEAPCTKCNEWCTPEGHDPCIGTLQGVKNACCGHGDDKTAYVQFDHPEYKEDSNKYRISGEEALAYISKHRGD